ncbi:MAG: hypothetical protein DCC65_14710 [Planctomycetota bacterium]|nr:MAG: hypothetical protein DCC65_14710 [Planctomycetota bacterium]
MKKSAFILLSLLGGVLLVADLHADSARCPILSAGAETTLPGSYHNVGQSVIGVSTGATIHAHHGGLACLRVQTSCLLGDVNGDGLVDGLDIDPYTNVNLSGVGTPRELCAASPDVTTFVDLLLD